MVHLEAPPEALGRLWDGSLALEAVSKYVARLGELTRIRAVVAIGSRASGDWKPWSDIDIIIVCEQDVRHALASIPGFGIIDPRLYTPDSLIEGIAKCEVELVEAFERGLVLYDDGIWSRARAFYEHVKATLGLEEYGPGWRIRRRVPWRKLAELGRSYLVAGT